MKLFSIHEFMGAVYVNCVSVVTLPTQRKTDATTAITFDPPAQLIIIFIIDSCAYYFFNSSVDLLAYEMSKTKEKKQILSSEKEAGTRQCFYRFFSTETINRSCKCLQIIFLSFY